MTLFIYLFGFLSFVVGLGMRGDHYASDNQKKYGVWVMQAAILALAWNTVSYNLFAPEEKWGAGSIQLVGNTVCVSHNDKIINLNSTTGKNFMPGDFVVIKTTESQWFLGVYYPETVKYYHWKELPAGMNAVKPLVKKEEDKLNDT